MPGSWRTVVLENWQPQTCSCYVEASPWGGETRKNCVWVWNSACPLCQPISPWCCWCGISWLFQTETPTGGLETWLHKWWRQTCPLVSSPQLKILRTGLLNFYPHLLRQKFSGSSSPWPVALLELVSETAFLFTGCFLFKLQVVIGNILQEHRQRRMWRKLVNFW